jgi:hypothetical protein
MLIDGRQGRDLMELTFQAGLEVGFQVSCRQDILDHVVQQITTPLSMKYRWALGGTVWADWELQCG